MNIVEIRGVRFSKVVCGSNPFYGHSHFSEARNREYINRFDDAYIINTIKFCISKGVNTIESSANERIWEIIAKLRLENVLNYIGTTRIDETSPMKSHQEKLKFLLDVRADVCVIHSQFVDRPREQGDIKGLEQLIDQIHGQNLLAGISTHRVSTVELCEKKNYGIDLYLFPLNLAGFVNPWYEGNEPAKERVQLIRSTDKPFVVMKSLASGRIPPQEGLSFVLESIKETDLITLGIGSVEEAAESIEIVEKYLQKDAQRANASSVGAGSS
ncbi:MAG: hypothetical protein ACE144_11330 [Thermodesulfobacteriota bacterium]